MPLQSATQTLLLMPDPRQTPLGERSASGLQRMAYTAYGQRNASSGPGSRTGFNGQLREPQGWYHLGNGHRVYNPVLMRFHSPDLLSPFGKGGLNCYAYCVGDPVNCTDPTGQWPNWAQPAITLTLNIFLFAAHFLTVAVNPAGMVGLALFAVRMSMMGAAVGAAGSLTQLAQLNGGSSYSAGRVISFFGSALTLVGTGSRIGLYLSKLHKAPGGIRGAARQGARRIFLGKGETPPASAAPTPTPSPPPSPVTRAPTSAAPSAAPSAATSRSVSVNDAASSGSSTTTMRAADIHETAVVEPDFLSVASVSSRTGSVASRFSILERVGNIRSGSITSSSSRTSYWSLGA